MGIKKEGSFYKVESASRKGKFYTVDPDKPSCDCAHFIFRMRKIGGVCKHITEVRKLIKPNEKKPDKILADIRNGDDESIELIKRYGEDAVNQLIQRGDVFEKAGKLYILE